MKNIFPLCFFGLVLAWLCPTRIWAGSCRLTVSNPSGFDRFEVVELQGDALAQVLKRTGAQSVSQLTVRDAGGFEVTSQPTKRGTFLFEVQLLANRKYTYTISSGERSEYSSTVFAAVYPERLDDAAWENDCIAFRAYGPSLQRSGEKAFGYDVWVKNTSDTVVNQRYRLQLMERAKNDIDRARKDNPKLARLMERRISYHVDHGNGMDCYRVGATLGCGAPALLGTDGMMSYPWAYKECEIVEKGPLRVCLKMNYGEREVEGVGLVKEEREVVLDKFSQLNRITVSYSGLTRPTLAVAGLAVHMADTTSVKMMQKEGIMAYADPTDGEPEVNGNIYVGCVFVEPLNGMSLSPFKGSEAEKRRTGDYGHLLGIKKVSPKAANFTYYSGATWSRFRHPLFEDWWNYLKRFSEQVKHPLRLKVD